ncbi:MAG: hypothetical protein E5X53_32695 [Mesorhizobium sp.]|uniref:hypothetical protein n=1 Tax=Mesorhizobium sp. TaxID=1871066 RepID=UPI0012191DE1|nr:hypothetical protein [Mesorhizobium sp.]TIP69429.1 MAG: hypothetical protein E5X55_32290 [Mesorhizobium sp.]TIQ03497.1 MAG: hypothetical protein E5X57_30740 [Mesorhizobium sp.]TIR47728.1 MAG: hypothetical protein E5X53_32695 [Mesorhizobium sp.]TJV94562.1 MAG: hypothetical protein E5X52_28520 [Mesorhizobium sp.]
MTQPAPQSNGHAGASAQASRPGAVVSGRLGITPTAITPPMALNGAAVLHFADAKQPDVVLSLMARALDAGRSAAEKASQIRAALLSDTTLTEPARHLRIKQEVIRALEPALREIDAKTDAAQAEIAKIRDAIASPALPTGVLDNFVMSAVLTRLSGMKPAERSKVLAEALANGDDRTVGIVLTSPPWLSGLSQNEHDLLRARFGLQRHAEQMKRVERLEKATEAMTRARTATESYAAGMFNKALADEAELALQRTAAALGKG